MPNSKLLKDAILLMQFSIALFAIFGSLVFSEILNFPPCDLCWYQRICMYPIAVIIATGLFLKSKEINKFILPFVSIGFFISIYHNLIYYRIIEIIKPCTENAPCTAVQLNMFGFITIPLMSFLGFLVLLILNVFSLFIKEGKNEK